MATIDHINVTMAAKIKTGVGWKNFSSREILPRVHVCMCLSSHVNFVHNNSVL